MLAPIALDSSTEEICERSWELVAADEPSVIAKSFLDPIVVEDSQGDRGFPNSTCADESEWGEVFSETNDLLDQLVATEAGPRCWGWQFSQITLRVQM
jgi:hypothetical protein